jgi:hypothetical protein
MKIVSASIGPYPKSMFDPMPTVSATFEDGTMQKLFSFYPDEISFSPEEFIGLTEREAVALFHRKDVSYLQS